MDTPLIIDEKDPKWTLLRKILATVASRRVKPEMGKHGIAPVNMAGVMLKVANLFRYHISCIVYPVSCIPRNYTTTLNDTADS